MRNLIFSMLALAAMAAAPFSPATAASADEARARVDIVAGDTLKIIQGEGDKAQKQAKMEKLFSANVDIPWVGRFVLGRYWRTATPEQRTKYIKAYEGFILSRYASRFADLSGGSYKILDSKQDEEGQFYVSMEMRGNDGKPVLVDYRLHSEGKQLKLFDVIVEGVSMITTQRSEFAAVIGGHDLDYLIQQLQSRSLDVNTGG